MLATIQRALLLVLGLATAHVAHAIPAFAQQTGQACEECHVGAYGPQLKPYGRDFKLYGYVSSDGERHLPTVALTLQSGLSHTAEDQAGLGPGFAPNNNAVLSQQASLYFGGRLTPSIGAFIQTTYDGQARQFFWDNTDIRSARDIKLFGTDGVVGVTFNNSPTVQDLWNSTPVWGYPYNGSAVAPAPSAASLIDGGLGTQVIGIGAYTMWNNWIYAEATAYQGLSARARNAAGVGPQQGAPGDLYDGLLPYYRLAVQHELTERHYFEMGVFGLSADRFPGGDRSSGMLDHVRDRALDLNYQFTGNPDHFVSAHATLIQENLTLDASRVLLGTQASAQLRTARADISYSYRDRLTPTVQIFETTGTGDPALWGTASGSPNSRGVLTELAYVPFGHGDSNRPWFNVRLSLQYISYSRFNGSTAGASGYNTLYLSLWSALAPFYAYESHH